MHLPWLPQLHRCFQSSLLCRFRCPRGLQWCSQHLQSRYPDWLHGPVVVELQTTGHMHSSHRWIRSLKQELQPTCQKLRQQSLWEFPTGLKKNQSKGQGKTKPRSPLRTIGHFKCNFMIGISFGWGKLTPCGYFLGHFLEILGYFVFHNLVTLVLFNDLTFSPCSKNVFISHAARIIRITSRRLVD